MHGPLCSLQILSKIFLWSFHYESNNCWNFENFCRHSLEYSCSLSHTRTSLQPPHSVGEFCDRFAKLSIFGCFYNCSDLHFLQNFGLQPSKLLVNCVEYVKFQHFGHRKFSKIEHTYSTIVGFSYFRLSSETRKKWNKIIVCMVSWKTINENGDQYVIAWKWKNIYILDALKCV